MMKRKQIYIEREQDERLKRAAAERKVSEAEIIREAIDRYLGKKTPPPLKSNPKISQPDFDAAKTEMLAAGGEKADLIYAARIDAVQRGSYDSLIVIDKGVQEGDRIIVGNLQKITTGAPVQPQPAKDGAA